MKARRRPPTSNGMNKAEQAYALRLLGEKAEGRVHSFRFEPIQLVLAPRMTFCPDFMVLMEDGLIEFHEVKVYWAGKVVGMREDAAVKLKCAARMFPEFTFRLVVQRKGGTGWDIKEIEP